jgi:FlaG/FlaF family flagellin (archaellin)
MKVAIIITAILLVAVTAGAAAQPQQHEALAQPSSASSPPPAATMNTTTTTTMTEEVEELVSLSANDTSTTQNVTFYTGTDIKSVILGQLFGSNVTDYDLYENGTAVATFTGGTHSGIEVNYNHSLTAENGYRYENGTIYSPDGRELRIVLQD